MGELSVLNRLLIDGSFRLQDVEYPLPNGKRADFALMSANGLVLLEVGNIDMEVDRIITEADLDKFITNRTEQKLLEKLSGIPVSWQGEFYLVQVLWGDILKLHHFKSYFARRTKFKRLVVKLMMVAQLFDTKAEIPRYNFMAVDDYLAMKPPTGAQEDPSSSAT